MQHDLFFRGLLAQLRADGTDNIDARNDQHQRQFKAVVELLSELRAAGTPGLERMPAVLFPGPVSGTYQEFDDALLGLQDVGYTAAQNPYYTSVTITLTPDRAQRVLERFNSDERDVLARLATAFDEAGARLRA